MVLKQKISSPLEAGPSILDAHHLPPQLTPALEYTSSRLANKSLHLTLVVVRRDYQLPVSPTTPNSPPLTGSSTGSGRFPFSSRSPVVALKQLVRSASQHASFGSSRPNEPPRAALSFPACPPTAFESPSPRIRWPLSPTMPLSPPPMTPCTTSSTTTTTTTTTTDTSGPPTPNPSGLRFFHASDMSPKAAKILNTTLSKAGTKFGTGSAWLSPFASPTTRELTNQLFHSSVVQNEVLFSSDGLTLLALDHMYSVKSALSSYSKTSSPLRLEDAVDELRRFVLASNGRKVSRSDLLRSYDWLSVSNSAIADLDRMYRRAYGGLERIGGISSMPKTPEPWAYKPSLGQHNDDSDNESLSPCETILDESTIGLAVTTVQVFRPPFPRKIGPLLKLRTNFEPDPKPKAKPEEKTGQEDENEDEDGERTARPTDQSAMRIWKSFTIDQVLSAETLGQARNSAALGPMTPNAYDDISPTTRGEWGFLMVDNRFKGGGRTVAVETC